MRPLVYAAHPMTTYGTPREGRALAHLVEIFPDAEIVNPAGRYRDSAHWLREWKKLVPQLAAVVVFGDRGATIGTGCIHELADAWRSGIPVAMLGGRGQLRRVAGLKVFDDPVRTSLRAAALVPGRPMVLIPELVP